MDKVASSVSIIGGADGPTSIFIAGKGGKLKLTTRIQFYIDRALEWDETPEYREWKILIDEGN